MPDPSHPHPGIWASIAAVFRQNRVPCLLLNMLVITLVASYYLCPQVAGAWQALGAFKTRWSYLFSFGSTVFSAVVLPFAVQGAMGTLLVRGTGVRPAMAGEGGVQGAMGTLLVRGRLRRFICLALFWGYRGMEIDLFYKCQGWLFGQGNDLRTLAAKVAVDQFVYSTFWAVPTYVIVLRWVDLDCSWPRTRASLDRHFWVHTCPAVLFTNWLVWIPAVALVYSLPAPLQFPLFSVVMCFFVLIVTLLARGHRFSSPPAQR